MKLDVLSLAACLGFLVCRNKVLMEEKESLEVTIATLYIELRHAKVHAYAGSFHTRSHIPLRQPEHRQRQSPRELSNAQQRSINESPA